MLVGSLRWLWFRDVHTTKIVMLFYSSWGGGKTCGTKLIPGGNYTCALWKLIELKVHAFWSGTPCGISCERNHSMRAADTWGHRHSAGIQSPGLGKAADSAVLEGCWSRLGKTSQAWRKLLLGLFLPPQELVKQQNFYYVQMPCSFCQTCCL